jgi:hypothetical protein
MAEAYDLRGERRGRGLAQLRTRRYQAGGLGGKDPHRGFQIRLKESNRGETHWTRNRWLLRRLLRHSFDTISPALGIPKVMDMRGRSVLGVALDHLANEDPPGRDRLPRRGHLARLPGDGVRRRLWRVAHWRVGRATAQSRPSGHRHRRHHRCGRDGRDVENRLLFRPSKTRAGWRQVRLPRRMVDELALPLHRHGWRGVRHGGGRR